MSYSTIIGVYPSEKTNEVLELRNSHGTAPPVWEAMAGRYLGVTKAYSHPDKGWMQLEDELWDLWKRRDIPLDFRMVFMFTFDRAYIAKKDYKRMAEAINHYLKEFPPHPGHVSHWQTIADLFASDPDIPGLGLYATSVSENPFNGTWNEDKDDYDPVDWDQVYDIYERIKEADAEAV